MSLSLILFSFDILVGLDGRDEEDDDDDEDQVEVANELVWSVCNGGRRLRTITLRLGGN